MFPSAFASLRSDPVSRAYYQRKRQQGKRHNQAVLALAHRRILTLHAMIRNHTLNTPQPATKLPTSARHTTQGHPPGRKYRGERISAGRGWSGQEGFVDFSAVTPERRKRFG